MIKNNLKFAALTILIFCFAGRALAQIPVRKGPASAEEIKKAKDILDTNMNSLGAHKAYIYAMGISNPLVIKQYNEWMKKYPQNINIPLAIGTVYYNAEMPQAKQFLLRVVESEPGNAKVWYMLSADAERWGQEDLSAKYMRKAALADSSNADYAFYYLLYFENGDPKEYARRVFDFVKRFPANNHGAQALYWLAENTIDANDKISYFEELRKLYPPQKFQWSSVGMMRLTDAYLQINPEKALALINEMGGGKDWAIRKQVAESLIQVNKLEQDQNYKEALLKLDEIKLPKFTHLQDFIVLKKFSLEAKAGDVKTAYDSVAARFARLPTDQLYTELELLGGKIGKNKAQISKDIVTIRNSTAVTAYPFELGLYTGNGTLNLNSLKGKVVLLTFWFPACGPCRDEFPHFQAVINKFKGEDVAYIGINISPDQDPYVIPFMKNTKYSFIPLRGSPEFAAKYYGVDGEPGNFLIDKNGKIVFKDFNIGSTNQRTLQLMISSLLKKNQPDN